MALSSFWSALTGAWSVLNTSAISSNRDCTDHSDSRDRTPLGTSTYSQPASQRHRHGDESETATDRDGATCSWPPRHSYRLDSDRDTTARCFCPSDPRVQDLAAAYLVGGLGIERVRRLDQQAGLTCSS